MKSLIVSAFLSNILLVSSSSSSTIRQAYSTDCNATPFAYYINLSQDKSLDGKCTKEGPIASSYKAVRNYYAQPEPIDKEYLRFKTFSSFAAGGCTKGFENEFIYVALDKATVSLENAPCLPLFDGGQVKLIMTGSEYELHFMDKSCANSKMAFKAARSHPGLCIASSSNDWYQFDIVKGSTVAFPPGEVSPYAWNTESGVRIPPTSGAGMVSGGSGAGTGSSSGNNGQTGGSVASPSGNTQTPSSGAVTGAAVTSGSASGSTSPTSSAGETGVVEKSSIFKKGQEASNTTSGANAVSAAGILSLVTLMAF